MSQLRLSQEFSAGDARLRVDVHGSNPVESVLEDMNFLNYRLADVRIEEEVTLPAPDIVWEQEGPTSVGYENGVMKFAGDWAAGPLQKVIVAMLALKMEATGCHPFHASAVRYKGKTILFLGGESNHGKSMCQIEACRRGAELVSTETTVVAEDGRVVAGSKDVFLKKRTKGTERADKASPNKGVEKFFGEMPSWDIAADPGRIDLVVVPAIDGNFDTSMVEMIPFEAQFQSFHSLQNYFLLNEVLAPGYTMPLVDSEPLRAARAHFLESFCDRPYYFVRAATPQALMDELEQVV